MASLCVCAEETLRADELGRRRILLGRIVPGPPQHGGDGARDCGRVPKSSRCKLLH